MIQIDPSIFFVTGMLQPPEMFVELTTFTGTKGILLAIANASLVLVELESYSRINGSRKPYSRIEPQIESNTEFQSQNNQHMEQEV